LTATSVDAPWVTLTVVGGTVLMLKSPVGTPAVTVSASGVVTVPVEPTPCTCRLVRPSAAFAATVSVSTELLPCWGLTGANDAVTPVGRLSTDSTTSPVKLTRLMLTVVVGALAACGIESAAWVSDSVKLAAGAVTVSASGAVASVMPVPVAPAPSGW
jgi:hypothetical protein